jgi:hypothetical protein
MTARKETRPAKLRLQALARHREAAVVAELERLALVFVHNLRCYTEASDPLKRQEIALRQVELLREHHREGRLDPDRRRKLCMAIRRHSGAFVLSAKTDRVAASWLGELKH